MNIFVLDRNPKKCAEFHCDKHTVKMILEYSQLMCTVHRKIGNDAPYRKTHSNNPCTLWLEESIDNYNWLLELAENLVLEYRKRFESDYHKCTQVIAWCRNNKPKIESKGITSRPKVMPDEYKQDDVVESYREYYKDDKSSFAEWTNKEPYWWL